MGVKQGSAVKFYMPLTVRYGLQSRSLSNESAGFHSVTLHSAADRWSVRVRKGQAVPVYLSLMCKTNLFHIAPNQPGMFPNMQLYILLLAGKLAAICGSEEGRCRSHLHASHL